MKWLSNTYDPNRADAFAHIIACPGMTQMEAWQAYQEWLRGKIIGPPKATELYTREELSSFYLVGVYEGD